MNNTYKDTYTTHQHTYINIYTLKNRNFVCFSTTNVLKWRTNNCKQDNHDHHNIRKLGIPHITDLHKVTFLFVMIDTKGPTQKTHYRIPDIVDYRRLASLRNSRETESNVNVKDPSISRTLEIFLPERDANVFGHYAAITSSNNTRMGFMERGDHDKNNKPSYMIIDDITAEKKLRRSCVSPGFVFVGSKPHFEQSFSQPFGDAYSCLRALCIR